MRSDSIFGLLPRSTWMIRCAMRSTVVACGVTETLRRVLQHLAAELGDVLRHGGREHQRLPLRRELRHDLPDVADEAHVEHAVGFVEHEHLDAARVEPGDDAGHLDEVGDLLDERRVFLELHPASETPRVQFELARDAIPAIGVIEDDEVLGQLRLVLLEAADLDRRPARPLLARKRCP